MKLLTKEIANKLPTLDETRDTSIKDLAVHWKLFNPYGGGTWYIYAYDPEDKIAMAFVNLGDPIFAELGSVSIQELEELKVGPFGGSIERDKGFRSTPLREIMDKVKSGGHV